MYRAVLLAALLASLAALSSIAASAPARTAGPGTRVLTIRVVNDVNENGIWDDGEPGLVGWAVVLMCGDVITLIGETGSEGELVYRKSQGYECVNVSVKFGWLPTSATRVRVEVPPDEEVEVVFLVRKVGEDVQRFFGIPIVDGLPASLGVTLDALVDGVSCGDGIVAERDGLIRYELYVLGASERPGCAQNGDEVLFTIDRAEAGSATFSARRRQDLDLIAGSAPMYFSFWFYSPPLEGAVVPYVGSTMCGQAFLETFALAPPNFQTVFVTSEATQPGCGAPGRAVTLRIGDAVLEQLVWEEGRVASDHLQHVGDANCDGTVDSIDAVLVLQHDAGLQSSLECAKAANVNGDAGVNSVDAALVLQFHARLISYFP